jgi:hypothetical protein
MFWSLAILSGGTQSGSSVLSRKAGNQATKLALTALLEAWFRILKIKPEL